MSYIRMTDPHPGRCLNHRTTWVNGQPLAQRCLDYDGTEHTCSFPPLPKPAPPGMFATDSYSVVRKDPEPWVKP